MLATRTVLVRIVEFLVFLSDFMLNIWVVKAQRELAFFFTLDGLRDELSDSLALLPRCVSLHLEVWFVPPVFQGECALVI